MTLIFVTTLIFISENASITLINSWTCTWLFQTFIISWTLVGILEILLFLPFSGLWDREWMFTYRITVMWMIMTNITVGILIVLIPCSIVVVNTFVLFFLSEFSEPWIAMFNWQCVFTVLVGMDMKASLSLLIWNVSSYTLFSISLDL